MEIYMRFFDKPRIVSRWNVLLESNNYRRDATIILFGVRAVFRIKLVLTWLLCVVVVGKRLFGHDAGLPTEARVFDSSLGDYWTISRTNRGLYVSRGPTMFTGGNVVERERVRRGINVVGPNGTNDG